MEDFRYDLAKGARSVAIEPFTLLGATTEPGLLLRPFYDRFEHHFFLEYYSVEELSKIIEINSRKLKCNIDKDSIKVLAKLSRFTPRIANSLLKWCNDFARANNTFNIDKNLLIKAIKLKGIDSNGLDGSDRKYVEALKRVNKPLGLNTICAMTGLAKETVEQQIEPYLFKLGMISKTPKGRMLL
jgi:Holliday junction DNA helicase RuvB